MSLPDRGVEIPSLTEMKGKGLEYKTKVTQLIIM